VTDRQTDRQTLFLLPSRADAR